MAMAARAGIRWRTISGPWKTMGALPLPEGDVMNDPTGPDPHQCDFSVDELFFSTTDRRGIITAWNEVFVRISGYAPAELLGRPHNIIRHRDMPKGVFYLLWENLNAGRPFAGYVKNCAKTGAYYWVFAVNVPIADGFLSVRFKPTGPIFATIRAVYEETLAREAQCAAQGLPTPEIARAGADFILEQVRGLGFAGYDAFAQHAFAEEIRLRDETLRREGRTLFPDKLECGEHRFAHELLKLYPAARRTCNELDGLFQELDSFATLSSELQRKAGAVLAVTKGFHLNAMNAYVAAQRLGNQAVSLGPVADFLGYYAHRLADETARLERHIEQARGATEATASAIATARLQMEMILFFLAEISRQAAGNENRNVHQLARLERAFADSGQRALEAVQSLQAHIPEIRTCKKDLVKTIVSLEVTQVSGLTEATRMVAATNLRAMFKEFRAQIATVRCDLDALDQAIEESARLVAVTPGTLQLVAEYASTMRPILTTLAAGL